MNNNLTQTKLTPHLWELYHFILDRSVSNMNTSVKDICEKFPTEYKLNAKESNFTNCPDVYRAIDTLNESTEIEKIIVKAHNNFKVATEEEAKLYQERIKRRALKQLSKYWVINSKILLNGYGKLVSCQDKAIDGDSKARPFVESFLEKE